MDQILRSVALSALFTVLGFVFLFVGFKVLDMMTPASLEKKILEEGNLAAAILAGAFILALAIIINAAIS